MIFLHLLGSFSISHSLSFYNCYTNVICYGPVDDGVCGIRYDPDPSFHDRNPIINGSLKSNISLPFLQPNTLIYYQIFVNERDNFILRFQGNFTTGQRELTPMNIYFVGITVYCNIEYRVWVDNCSVVKLLGTIALLESPFVNITRLFKTLLAPAVIELLSLANGCSELHFCLALRTDFF